MFKVLAIDGGGIRGVIPAVLLDHLEQKSGAAISQTFDLVVGTSTGGILAAGLTVPQKAGPKGAGRPKFSGADMVRLYAERGREIFSRSFWDGVTALGGLADERYNAAPLETILKDYLGEARLRDCLKPVVITSYDIERRRPYFFKTRRARWDKDRDHLLRDAARATCAAPTYFEPALIASMAASPTRRALVDGGVFVNNPALCGFVEALAMGARPDETLVLSIGTGVSTRTIRHCEAKDWGMVQWVKPIFSVMMDGQADSADFQLRELLPDAAGGKDQRYFRFDKRLETALDDLDAAHAGNIDALKSEAATILRTRAAEFRRALSMLKI